MRKQRLFGVLLILLSVAILALAAAGQSPDEQDATVVLLILPLGIYMVVTKQCILYP